MKLGVIHTLIHEGTVLDHTCVFHFSVSDNNYYRSLSLHSLTLIVSLAAFNSQDLWLTYCRLIISFI